MNTLLINGRVKDDYAVFGNSILTFNIVRKEYYTNTKGEQTNRTCTFKCISYGEDRASIVKRYARKGNHIAVEGELTENRFGNGGKVSNVEIRVIRIYPLDDRIGEEDAEKTV